MLINLSELIVTQDELRNEQQICKMIEFVRQGGVFSQRSLSLFAEEHNPKSFSSLIKLNQFEDGKIFIHDGHHRILSIHLGGRQYLLPEEFLITRKSYHDYLDIVFEKDSHWIGWVTPHDVRNELRFPDISKFKEMVIHEFLDNGENAARKIILANREIFAKPRTVQHIHELSIIEKLQQVCNI